MYRVRFFILAGIIVSLTSIVQNSSAQGVANINVIGIPPVIEQPFTDTFEQNVRNGKYQVIFTYNTSNSAPADFRFRFRLTKGGKELINVVSEPRSFRSGAYVFTSVFEELPFSQSFGQVISQVDNNLVKQVVQEGTIPEGNYLLKITPIADDGAGMIATPPSVTNFTVRYPQAPTPINPPDQSNLVLETPLFNWTPVIGMQDFAIEYDFLLVEVLDTQTSLQALNSNRAHAQRTLTEQLTLVYTPEFLPLEEGKQYAWQITASSQGRTLPIKNDGVSDIRTFVYKGGNKQLSNNIDDIKSIPLIPGFARLTNLDDLDIDERSNVLVFDGEATIELDYGRTYELPVDVRGLTIQKGSSNNPVVMAGMVEVQSAPSSLPVLSAASNIVQFNRLRWTYSEGIQATGEVKLPNGKQIAADGWVQLTTQGLSGSLVADNPAGIIQVGEDPVELYIERFEASFPQMQLYAEGRVELFGGESVCDLTQLNVLEDQSQAVFNCPDDAAVSLVENSAQLELLLDNLGGVIDYDFGNDVFTYNLDANGGITLGLDQVSQCKVQMRVNLESANGLSISQVTPVCSMYAPPINLGFVKLKLDGIDLQSLTYNSGSNDDGGNWDFDLSLDGAISFPAIDGWTLPISTINVTRQGLIFPDLDWNALQLGLNQPLLINGFQIEPKRFEMPEFTFPFFDWSQEDTDSNKTGNWNFSINFDFKFPDFGRQSDGTDSDSTSILPACLAARSIQGIEGNFDKGDFLAKIPATVLKDCRIEFAESYTFIINELGGELMATASASDFGLESELSLDAELEAGFPFNCGSNKTSQAASTQLSMNSDGLLEGNIKDIVNNCAAELGPFTASITESDLIFEIESDQQQLAIEAGGALSLNNAQRVDGNLRYAVLNGEFDMLDFTYEDVFLLNLPSKDNAVLSFLVEGLSLTKDGILINGRHEFVIGDPRVISRLLQQQTGEEIKLPKDITTIGVTFDKTLFAIDDFGIKSGRIIFDESFSLKAGVDQQTTDISFEVIDPKKKIEMDQNSLYAALGGRVMIDKDGLHSRGTAEAAIRVGDLEFKDILVEFSKQFAMALDPFGVQQGQADLLHKNRRIAYVNSSGFHFDPSYLTQAIPDTLPLPTKETAYIVLRDQNDSLKVNAQRESDGTFTMSTTNPVDLVVPFLQKNNPQPPSVQVSFTDITYEPGSGEVTAGSIQGDFNPAIDLNNIGVPLRVKRVRYDDGLVVNNQSFGGERGLFLEGDLLLYEHQVGDNGSVALYLENGNRLRGDVDLTNLDSDIPLVPQSDFAVLNIDSLKGNVNVPLDELSFPDVSFNMGGQLRFQEGQQSLAALNYRANYDDEIFSVSALNQPTDSDSGNNTAFLGSTGFRIDEIKTLTLNYRSATHDFDFNSELDFSILMNLQDDDTLEVPLKSVEITEQGFLIPGQTINSSSQPALNAPPVMLGPTELTVLEFRVLQDISFNWFMGEGIAPSFEMDLDMKLEALSQNSPQASDASLTLNNVGYNQGVITGQLQDYPFQGDGAPISLGGNTQFNLTEISGGLTNDGTIQNPVQGFNINLTGNLETPELFATTVSNCTNPALDLNLSGEGGLVGSVSNIAPCGDWVYGPATIEFDTTSTLHFSFANDVQSIVLDGSVTAEIEQPENPNIVASGDIELDVINADLISGSILITDLFTYEYPQNNPLFTFRVQQAQLDQSGLVFTGDAGLTFPNSEDTARVQFTNFTIHPKDANIAGGSLTIQDSVAFEVGISPINWKLVDPSSEFTRNNTGRLLTAAGITIDSGGLTLSGSSTAKIKAGGQSFPDVSVDYNNFQIGFAPTKVTAGQADFTLSDESSPFGYLDNEKFHLNLPGLITSIIPDTLGLPNRETAFLVLGDESGNRYELDENQSPRELRTLSGKTIELVIPEIINDQNDTLKVQVAFDIAVDQFMNITSGSVTLANSVDLADYIDIPLSLDSLNYSSADQELVASATVTLPSSLNDIELKTSAVIGNNGFEQASISAGEYSENYFATQENVTPIASDSLGNGALAFFVRGLELEFGQTNSLAFSGQIKSELLQNNAGERTPIHYAASYASDQWDVAIDNGNLMGGIDLGFAQLEPIPNGNQTFTVTMDQDEFAVAFAGIISMPELLGDGFSLEIQQLKVSTLPNQDGDYVTANAQQNLPDQNFQLINGILDLTSTNTSVSITNQVLAIQTSGTFNFYNKQDIGFQDLRFSSDGTVNIGGVSASNLLEDPIELLSDSSLVLSDLSLGVENDALMMSATGFAKLPDPLNEQAGLTISADTDGNIDVSGPDFVFDEDYSIDGGPTEYSIENFATLEMTGLGININFSQPDQTSLYAAGVIYIDDNVDKRIMFGDAGNLQQEPGIKYSPVGGVEWNVSSNFDPNESPLAFDYEFFSISVSSIQIENNIIVDGQEVPFQAEIGGKTGLNLAGVGGTADFSGFKFSTLGVDDIGKIDGGGTFTLMNIVSLELGSFDYQSAPEGQTVSLVMPTSSGSADSGASVVSSNTVEVTKYLHFAPSSSGEALQLSLSEGISGGVEEVIYYQKGDGENYLRIKKASLQLNDQAGLVVGMEFITNSNEFSLSVAGEGHFGDQGIAASGSISTINNNLRFGVFVAATGSVNILGIVEASGLGGGFYYRPTQENIDMTIAVVEGLDDKFKVQQQPDVQNLKFAIFLYAGISIGGVGDNAAISASALIQVTDQFTKIDAVGEVLNQGNKFQASLYLTILYTPEIAGVEGGVSMDITYAPVMEGSSEVDFFAKKDRTNSDPVMWGITGNFQLEVLPQLNMLSVEGTLIVSPDGLLLELGASSGFNVAVISADASFELLVWYLPQHTDPMGIYGKFSISFSIVGGLAEFGASVEGGFFDRGSYVMIYFAGEAHVKVIAVIDADVRGWVKFQTKSPRFDYGRGGSAEMEKMIAYTKAKANKTKEKAEKTKNQLDEAKDELNDALAAAALEGYSAQQLRKAGFNIVSGKYAKTTAKTNKIDDVIDAERDLHGTVPDVIQWIEDNVMQGNKRYGGSPAGYDATRKRPEIKGPEPSSVSSLDDYSQLIGTQANAIQQVQNEAPQVESRINEAITELGALSDKMRTSLDQENTLTLSNPVMNVQDATTGSSGELLNSPSFSVNSAASDTNKSRLNRFDDDLVAADARYREAIKSVAGNVELIDLVASGEASITWGEDTGVQMQSAQGVSVNDLAYTYTNAVREIRDYNSELIGSYWNMADWAEYRYNYIDQDSSAIKSFARRTNDWSLSNSGDVTKAAEVVAARQYVMSDAQNTGTADFDAEQNKNNMLQNNSAIPMDSQDRRDLFKGRGEDFWYYMPLYGLDELRDLSAHKADSLVQFFDQKLSTIKTKHRAFTESVDELYTIKSEMLVTVYGMIEEYNGWRQEAYGENAEGLEAPFTNKKQDIEDALAPPTIDFISGRGGEGDITSSMSNYKDFYGIARLSYEASHAQGIPEMSYALMDGTSSTIYSISDYYTAGVWNSQSSSGAQRWFEMKFPKENSSQITRDLTGVVRARGAGGTTISRFVNFTIPVGRGGAEVSSITNQGDDSTPPTKPVITHNYESDANTIWTPDSTKLSLTFKSSDPETDVRLYKYKIGTTPGGNEIRGWTDAQGSRGTGLQAGGYQQVGNFYLPTYDFTSTMQTTIRGLNLELNTDYYISVKAVNGDNMESAVKDVSKPFRFEPTPPSRPEITITPAPSEIQRQQAPSQPVLRQAVMDIPDWSTHRVNDDQGADNRQEFTFSWSANDPESGIDGFSVATANSEDATASQVFRPDDVDYIPVSEVTEFSYTPTFSTNQHLYFRARNKANMNGSMRVVGPIRNVDISPPTTPDVRVRGSFDGFNIYVNQLSEDGQTGIRGYQYAVFNATGTDTIRSWPSGNTVDFELSNNAANQAEPPVNFVPWGAFIQPGIYRISVRAVNKQDMVSREVTNTDVLYDNTPPQRTVFEPSFNHKTGEISIRLIDLGDRESGLKSMRYRIVTNIDIDPYVSDPNNTFQPLGYDEKGRSILAAGDILNPKKGLTSTVVFQDLPYFIPVFFQITVQNNAGLERHNEVEIEISDEIIKQFQERIQELSR